MPDGEGASPLCSHQHELMGAKQFPRGWQRFRCGGAERCSRCRSVSPESGQFCFQCADRKEGARGPTVEHHLCVSSDVTRT